ncbi:ABC transporter substrate-binding protein [Agromyces sp. Root81]|uniref:ABC transporter substrate-binding protein n=1 Tax=Agromyces sp. Root81 TaxID=1736601 RepID=UPI0006F42E91|nr:extracellular solute-binding protein [Agromyces sp. Root81]KRC61464.1 ABC transporter substrate-binding protein [Agromyces sp. Root81]
MTRTRRTVGLALAALGMTAALAGCSTTASTGSGDADLTFMVFETPALGPEFWDQSIENALTDLPDVTVNKIVSPGGDRTAYAKQLQASDQFPDVLASITPRDFLEAGLLEPFDQDWLDENFILPEANDIDGGTYIPPTNSQVLPLVFYNKALFAEHGVEVPETWAEFVAAIEKFRAADVTPLELAGSEPWAASMPLVGLSSADVLGQDPEWIQKRYAGEVSFSDPLYVGALEKARDLVEMEAYDPAALSVDYATANRNFLDGKSAMYPMGSWFTGSSYITPEQAENIGAFPWPTDDGSIVVPFNVGGTTAVSSQSEHVDEATSFAKAWSLDPANLTVLIETDGAYPMFKDRSIEDFDVSVSGLYLDTYAYVTDENSKVSSFGWVNNNDSLAPGMNDALYALSQALFSDGDVAAQAAQLDKEWDAAVGK